MAGHLGLIVKATRHCNLRCAYCHDWRVGGDQRMAFPVMARMVAAALRDSQFTSVEFIWHGGEPTVLPISFYEKALYVQSRFRRPGQLVRNSLQTNGTRITPAWARFFARNRFTVSVSLDGPPPVHDRTRRYASGRGSYQDVARGMALLREHRIPFGVLMVIDDDALRLGADAIFDFFLDQGIDQYGLIPAEPANQPGAQPGTPTSHYVDPRRFTAFLIDMYDRWEEHGDPRILIRELDSLRVRIDGAESPMCTLAGACIGRYYAVEPNGDVAHCDRFVGDPHYTLGNVADHSFDQLSRSSGIAALVQEEETALDRLRSCPEFGVCNGGCPHDRYLARRHLPDHQADCCGLRELIGYVRRRAGRQVHGAPLA